MPMAARIGDIVSHASGVQVLVTGAPAVLIGGLPAARVGDATTPCATPMCPCPAPALVTGGSASVIIAGMPAARVGDASLHGPCGQGKIVGPGCATVLIGG